MSEEQNKAAFREIVIKPENRFKFIDLDEFWRYKDLLMLLVRRDFVSVYKQTILGPIWFVIQPVFTSLIFLLIFGKVARISTDGIPPMLFYLSGTVFWSFFAESVKKVSSTFRDNQHIFGKVYFPRLISPVSKLVSNSFKLAVQVLLLTGFFIYFAVTDQVGIPSVNVLYIPLLIILFAVLGLALGLIVNSLTTKYRDLTFLMDFGIQLFMYATPVIYPVSVIPEDLRSYAMLNPLMSVFECIKYCLFGEGYISTFHILYSIGFTLVALIIGMVMFNKTEKNFMDTV